MDRRAPVAVLAALLTVPLACGGDEPVSIVTVRIEQSRFDTAELVVEPGTTVRFVNDDAFAHTVTARDDAPAAFDSGALGQGDVFDVTFDAVGQYPYFCEIHPTMRARVVVR